MPEDLVGRVWGGKYRGEKQSWFAFRFTGPDTDIDLAADGHPEFDDWRWVSIETLPALAVAFKRPVYEESSRSSVISPLPDPNNRQEAKTAEENAAVRLPATSHDQP